MSTRWVIKQGRGGERRIRMSSKLAENAAYRDKHGLTLVPEIGETPKAVTKPEPTPKADVSVESSDAPETEENDIRQDAETMDVDTLKGMYTIDEWVVLAKELKLTGNLSRTGEAKLISRIKNKLAE